jgi:hypothetical protein
MQQQEAQAVGPGGESHQRVSRRIDARATRGARQGVGADFARRKIHRGGTHEQHAALLVHEQQFAFRAREHRPIDALQIDLAQRRAVGQAVQRQDAVLQPQHAEQVQRRRQRALELARSAVRREAVAGHRAIAQHRAPRDVDQHPALELGKTGQQQS